MDERPDAVPVSDDWDFLSPNLVSCGAFSAVPRVRTVKESVAQEEPFHFTRTIQKSRFNFGIHLCTCGHTGAGVDCQPPRLVGKSAIRFEEKAARLSNVSTNSAHLRSAVKVSAALKPQLAIAGEGSPRISKDL